MKSQVILPSPPNQYSQNDQAQMRRAISAEDLRNVKVDDIATAAQRGVVKADGSTITVAADGTISVPASAPLVAATLSVTGAATLSGGAQTASFSGIAVPSGTATTLYTFTANGIYAVRAELGTNEGAGCLVIVQDGWAAIIAQAKTNSAQTFSIAAGSLALKITQSVGSETYSGSVTRLTL